MKILANSWPIFSSDAYRDCKDPCPVFDGDQWHIFGSGGRVDLEQWGILHATAPTLHGPWTVHPTTSLEIAGSGVAAPGVIHDQAGFHMFVQTEFLRGNGSIEYLSSKNGADWTHQATVLRAHDGHGIYDPHPAVIQNRKYLVYSAFEPFTLAPQPDIFLLSCDDWTGPYTDHGRIFSHDDVCPTLHNRRDHPDYEWGLEGAQLVELPDGQVLLNLVAFLPDGARGTRQRVLFAIADTPAGPFRVLGNPIEPHHGENGHAAALIHDDHLVLFYQQRGEYTDHRWRYGTAVLNPQLTLHRAA